MFVFVFVLGLGLGLGLGLVGLGLGLGLVEGSVFLTGRLPLHHSEFLSPVDTGDEGGMWVVRVRIRLLFKG